MPKDIGNISKVSYTICIMVYDNIAIIVDMQNDFLLKSGLLYIGHDTKILRQNVCKFLQDFDGKIILTQDTHDLTDAEFHNFPKHCIQDSWGHAICSDILNSAKNYQIIQKHTFFSYDLIQSILNDSHQHTHFYVMGVLAHICVSDCITYLYNEFVGRFHCLPKMTILKNCIDDTNPKLQHNMLKKVTSIYGTNINQ